MRRTVRLGRAAAVGVALLVGAGATMTGSAAAASSGAYRCPKGYFCLFSGIDGKGTMWKYRTPQADLGYAGRHAVSWANRTKYYSCVFGGKNYTSSGELAYWWTDPAASYGFTWDSATGIMKKWARHFGSLNLAPTAHQCHGRTQWLTWGRPMDDYQGDPKPFGSFLGNGQVQVLMRSVQGHLWVLPGDYGKAVDLGGGWNSMTALTRHGDYTGDGREDIIARDTKGRLWLYPGNGRGHLGARRLLTTGWNRMTAIVGVGDATGDGKNDLMARDKAGSLWLYAGNGKGRFDKRHLLTTGWNRMTAIVGTGDLSGDGKNDIVARDKAGSLWLYAGNGKGRFGKRHLLTKVPQSWKPFAIGDVTGDRKYDLYAVDGNQDLRLFSGTGTSSLRQGAYYRVYLEKDPRELLF